MCHTLMCPLLMPSLDVGLSSEDLFLMIALVGQEDPKCGSDVKTGDAPLMMREEKGINHSTNGGLWGSRQAPRQV